MTTPGIHLNLSSEEYHAGPGVSKTGLWTIAKRTPAHYRFGERKDSAAFDLGTAAHLAVLQPELLETEILVGPDVNKNTNEWKAYKQEAAAKGLLLLDTAQMSDVSFIRDSAERNATIRDLRKGAIVEASGYAIDPETGVLVRCRPDAYNPAMNVILDLKTAAEGGRDKFGKAAADFGYHMQEAIYSDVWARALADSAVEIQPIEAFVFGVIEKSRPFLVSAYELKPDAVEEGRQAYRSALALYAQCAERENLGMPPEHAWPGYPEDPEPLDIPRWAYRHTAPPEKDA